MDIKIQKNSKGIGFSSMPIQAKPFLPPISRFPSFFYLSNKNKEDLMKKQMMKQLVLQQRIKFEAIDDFTGTEIERTGTIVGYSEDVRRRWPDEMALAINMLLVKVEMPERDVFYAVAENEVLEILKEQHSDECDCIECQARISKGGLDYDPSNDNEEFEEHERQVFRDVEIDKKREV